jgi:hypothetical protein
VNAVLGGPKHHEFWKFVIDELPKRYFANPEAEMVMTTGPALLTDCAIEWQRYMKRTDFVVLPTESFNSVHWSKISTGSDATELWKDQEGIVGIHHWGHKRSGRGNIVRKK